MNLAACWLRLFCVVCKLGFVPCLRADASCPNATAVVAQAGWWIGGKGACFPWFIAAGLCRAHAGAEVAESAGSPERVAYKCLLDHCLEDGQVSPPHRSCKEAVGKPRLIVVSLSVAVRREPRAGGLESAVRRLQVGLRRTARQMRPYVAPAFAIRIGLTVVLTRFRCFYCTACAEANGGLAVLMIVMLFGLVGLYHKVRPSSIAIGPRSCDRALIRCVCCLICRRCSLRARR